MILNCLESRRYCEAIMDDMLLFTPSKQMHMRKVEDFTQGLAQKWFSPGKCQLFKTELQYMGNTIFIQGKRVCGENHYIVGWRQYKVGTSSYS